MSVVKGKRVLVTGAASGIGAGTCRLLAEAGWKIAGLDRQAHALNEQMTRLRDEGHVAVGVAADVTSWDAVERATETAARELGGLDAAVNVAGIGGFTGDVVATSLEAWAAIVGVDLTGVFLVSRAAIPFIREAGGGGIVNISSQYGLVGGAGFPAYAAAKAGVIGLTRAMAVDHAAEGIRVNCVCPGPVDTPMLAADSTSDDLAKFERERVRSRLLLGRIGKPEDVGALVAFLLSDQARNMTGSIIATDGGWTAG